MPGRIEQLKHVRHVIKGNLSRCAKSNKDYIAQWEDELRVIEGELKDLGAHIRKSRVTKPRSPAIKKPVAMQVVPPYKKTVASRKKVVTPKKKAKGCSMAALIKARGRAMQDDITL